MFQSKPNNAEKDSRSTSIVNSVVREMLLSAGVALGGMVVVAFLPTVGQNTEHN